jgi:hypothetical protein
MNQKEIGDGLPAHPRNNEASSKLLPTRINPSDLKVFVVGPREAEQLRGVFGPRWVRIAVESGAMEIIDEVNT